jgi:hypothetical protein
MLQAWVFMSHPGSTRNKWLSFGISCDPTDHPGRSNWSTSIDVFDASPQWRPYTLTTSLPSQCSSVSFGFGTGAGDGVYEGWDRAAWIDDVQIAIEVPMKGVATSRGDTVVVRFSLPKNFTLSENFDDPLLWTGSQRPMLTAKSVKRIGTDFVCRYEAAGLGKLVEGGNPDTGLPGFNIQLQVKLRRGGLEFVGTCGSAVTPSKKP